MQKQSRNPAPLLATGLAVAAAIFAMQNAHASCGEQHDFLVRQDPLLASVRPADCATLLDGPPQFTWPLQQGRNTYTVSLRFPDGHVERRSTTRNWLAWDHAVPAGPYTWQVSVAGPRRDLSAARGFEVQRTQPAMPAREAAAKPADPPSAQSASTASSIFRVEPSESWIPLPKPAQPPRRAAVGGFFGGFTE